jgi:phage-related protein
MRARLTLISELIESVGLPNVKEPHVRHIRGQLWEIRLKGEPVSHGRAATTKDQRVVILRAFIKKSEKTPAAYQQNHRPQHRDRAAARWD